MTGQYRVSDKEEANGCTKEGPSSTSDHGFQWILRLDWRMIVVTEDREMLSNEMPTNMHQPLGFRHLTLGEFEFDFVLIRTIVVVTCVGLFGRKQV